MWRPLDTVHLHYWKVCNGGGSGGWGTAGVGRVCG